MSATWTQGTCWRCAATHRPVLWIGAAKTPSGNGHVFACEPCIRALDDLVHAQARARDGLGGAH